MDTIFGRRPVWEALDGNRRVVQVYVAKELDPGGLVDILELAGSRDVTVTKIPRAELDQRLGQAVHQGVAADVSEFKYSDLSDLLDSVSQRENSLVVALDQVTDPQNFGAVIRTAVAAGADGVLVGKRRTAPITPTVVKASAGLTERATIVSTNMSSALERLKESGFWVVGGDGGGKDRIWDLDLSGKVVIVLGSEGRGLSRLVRERCDWLAALPLAPGIDSLNVSAAAAAMIYEVVRQRQCRI